MRTPVRKWPARVLSALLMSALLTSAASAGPPLPAADPVAAEQAASILLAYGSRELGVPEEQLVMFGPDAVALPDESGNFAVANISAADGSRSVSGYLNLDSGEILGEDAFRELERAIAADMEPYTAELRAMRAAAAADERITIGVAVHGGSRAAVVDPVKAQFPDVEFDGEEPITDDPEVADAVQDAFVDAWSASAVAVTAPVVRASGELGMKVEYVGQLAPVFWVTGTKDAIARLALEEGVQTMYPSTGTTLTMNSARPTDQADYGIGQGWDGSGVRVAIVEYDNVNWSNSAFTGANCKLSYSTGAVTLDPSPDHPSWVMGAIGSQSSTHKGIAPEACLISVGTGGYSPGTAQDYEILTAIDIAASSSQGNADVISLSIVQDTSAGRAALRDYIDHVVRMGISVSASPGNTGDCGDDKVISPGTAWNVVTVGTIGDKNDSTWANDDVGDHCWIDPVGGNFKPEISAPGQDVTSAGQTFTPLTSYFTSIAVPQVAGTFAQVIEVNTTELKGSPVRVKAIVLAASHVHMLDAATAPGRLDDQEGMGSLTTKWATVIAARQTAGGIYKGNYGKRTFNATSFDPVSGCYSHNGTPQSQTFTLEPGKFTRVAVTWFSNGFYDEGATFGTNDVSSDTLNVDFDIRVYTANGTLKAFRYHELHNVEFVQFTAAAGESPYRLEIDPVEWGCGVASQAVGWAYVSWSAP